MLLFGIALGVLYLAGVAVRSLQKEPQFLGPVRFLFYPTMVLLLLRWLNRSRERLLWSLRNRLVVAYVFIAVVPTILLIAIAGLSAYIGYTQLAAYITYQDMQARVEKVANAADAMIADPRLSATAKDVTAASRIVSTIATNLPGARVEVGTGADLLKKGQPGSTADRFAGLVQSGSEVWLRAVAARGSGDRRRIVSVSVPIASEFLESFGADLGPLQFTITRPAQSDDAPGRVINIGDRSMYTLYNISAPGRNMPAAAHWLDYRVTGVSKLDVTLLGPEGAGDARGSLLASVSTRPSLLNRRLFNAPGEVGGLLINGLIFVGIVFLVLEFAALVTGVALTRTITSAVADLYGATRRVQEGDFSHRVSTKQKDQLGALGESFNAMTSSVAGLIEEQRQRQRLENELAIAQQVQSQLFPQELPSMPGLGLAAVCRAARVVSGDYYDFISLGPNRLGIAIADISGKGISAALLMASLQAALRSQVLLDGNLAHNTAELVSRLNRHLFLNTSTERYATFFYSLYDVETRTLHYTNAGHLPPFLVSGDGVKKLEEGGMVVGLFDNCSYEQGSVRVEPGSLLVAYSDGLIEPENVFGEQFGMERLANEVVRHRQTPPQKLAEMLVSAVEEWAGSQEQADDMTVIVARMD